MCKIHCVFDKNNTINFFAYAITIKINNGSRKYFFHFRGLQNVKRILSICKRTKGKSQWRYLQSLLAWERVWKIFGSGGQEKPLAPFFIIRPWWTFLWKHCWWRHWCRKDCGNVDDDWSSQKRYIKAQYWRKGYHRAVVRSVAKLKSITPPALIKKRNKILEKLKKFIEEI